MVVARCVLLLLVPLAGLFGQATCSPTPAYSPCDLVFELNEQEAAAHANPYLTVQLEVEFRSPRHRTFLLPGFWDGGRKMIVRFAPTEEGAWDFRINSNLVRFDGKEGSVSATPSDNPGFLRRANVHHWAYTGGDIPHLWMGDTLLAMGRVDRAAFDRFLESRAKQKFNHLRGCVLPRSGEMKLAYPIPDRPNPDYFRELEQRVMAMNRRGVVADLLLGYGQDELKQLFPTWQQRERYARYVVARFAALNITWQGVADFESYSAGRELLKEMNGLLKKLDPYQHPRSTGAQSTSSPLLPDGWMDYVADGSNDDQIGAIEHQLYPTAFVNLGVGSGDGDAVRRRLWNSSMNGQYPTLGNTAAAGDANIKVDGDSLDSPGARQMSAWYDFFANTRHWELEPFFDVEGGRALALEGVEYIVYIEKPGPVEVVVEKHGYDIVWFNPLTGERIKEKKSFKGDRFTGEPPDKNHDWVLHVTRESHKEGMLRSYKFESRPILMQEIEQNPKKVPFEVVEPGQDTLAVNKPVKYGLKLTRETRATRAMMYFWSGEAPAEGQGARVLATGAEGSLRVPAGLASRFPATFDIRVFGMNANGKVYSLDRLYQLTQ